MALSQIPAPSQPVVDPERRVTVPWFQFFMRMQGAVSASGAPSGGDYLVAVADPNLPNARVATDSPTVTVDLTVPGVIRWHAVPGVGTGWAPLTTGAEPLVFVSDGAGQCVMVPYP